jgi:PPOX class probable F420-dependent enzyme
MAITDERYVLLTSFKRDGTPVKTPVWIVDMGGGKAGFWTTSDTGKVKRLAHTPRVTLQPCNARGRVNPGSSAVDATATVVTGAELEAIHERVVAKYGVWTKLTHVMYKLMGFTRGKNLPYADRGVVITLSAA